LYESQTTQWIGVAAGVLTSVSLLPQLIKLMRTKKAEDVSLIFPVILFCGVGLWIWYGFLRSDVPIIATNSFSLLVNAGMIILGIKYKNRKT
jgi:MtN3 and saliva related transmembrane protein